MKEGAKEISWTLLSYRLLRQVEGKLSPSQRGSLWPPGPQLAKEHPLLVLFHFSLLTSHISGWHRHSRTRHIILVPVLLPKLSLVLTLSGSEAAESKRCFLHQPPGLLIWGAQHRENGPDDSLSVPPIH